MKHRILYVEDEKILGQLVTEALEKHGYQVQQVKNGIDALSAYRSFGPHLCLLDIMLPGKDGYDVATQIRQLDSKIPIIFLTAKVQVNDVVAGFKTGCNDYIRKPFSIDELLVRIESWLQEKYGTHNNSATEYTAGNLLFQPQQLRLIISGREQAITYKEASILATLFAHHGQVVSRTHLMQATWGSETIYNSRSLDVYINRLRKYLTPCPVKILTLKGVGYKLIAG